MHNVALRTAERNNGFDGDPAEILDKPSPNLTLAARHVELLTGRADTYCHFRVLRRKDEGGYNLNGRVETFWPEIVDYQKHGWGIFIVVNEGGHRGGEITRVRALFVDADGIPPPTTWHLKPDFIVRRDATHWHAYWIVAGMMKVVLKGSFREDFKTAQKRLAAYYGTDPKVADLPRIMRLAGSLHLKNPAETFLVTIKASNSVRTPAGARTRAELMVGLPEMATIRAAARIPTGEPISIEILAAMLACLDPSCDREEWIIILTALHAAPVPDDNDASGRLQLARDWSAGGSNYEGEDDVDAQFDSVAPGKYDIHVGTLIKKARDAGYDGPISIAEAERIRVWSAIAAKQQAEAGCWSKRTGAQPFPDFVFPKEFIEHARQQTAEAERRLKEAFPPTSGETEVGNV